MVSGKTGARFKAFDDKAAAERWLLHGAVYETKTPPKIERGVYFDAGTGRGDGVEVSVTDEKGKNLLHKALSKKEVNRFGKYLVGDESATNNYGELLALKYALEIARKEKIRSVFGDSKLVIDFWSRWRIKRKDLSDETVALADHVSAIRESFEADGGSVERISGRLQSRRPRISLVIPHKKYWPAHERCVGRGLLYHGWFSLRFVGGIMEEGNAGGVKTLQELTFGVALERPAKMQLSLVYAPYGITSMDFSAGLWYDNNR